MGRGDEAADASSAERVAAAAAAHTQHFIPVPSDRGLTPLDQSIAGAGAKAATKVLLYPVDTWKSRRQAGDSERFRGLWTIGGMYRGLAPKIVLYTPYQAIYMAVYTRTRDVLLAHVTSNPCVAFALAGVVAEVSGSMVRLPMEVAKLRMQLGIYHSSWHAMRDFARQPSTVFGNFVPQTLVHDCTYSALSWVVFEGGRQQLFRRNESHHLQPHESLLLGTLAGAVTGAATTPLDVVKTRIVGSPTRPAPDDLAGAACGATRSGGSGSGSFCATSAHIWRHEGPMAFWNGCSLRVAHLAPSTGLYFLLYEAAKVQIACWRGAGRQ